MKKPNVLLAAAFLMLLNAHVSRTQIPNDSTLIPGLSLDKIQPKNSDSWFWPRNFHELGWQWEHFRMLSPMAWMITMGRPEIVVAAHDEWSPDLNVYHPDMIPKTSPSNTGNFIVIGDSTVMGDGSSLSLKMGFGHGFGILSHAIARGNNDDASSGGGMIGTCPDCSGVGVSSGHKIGSLDTDMEVNNVLNRPAVLNISLGHKGRNYFPVDNYKTAIDSGVIVVSASANNRDDTHWGEEWMVEFDTATREGRKEMLPSRIYPAALAWTDPADPEKDYEVISVGGTYDGEFVSERCVLWEETNPNDSNTWNDPTGLNWNGSLEQFVPDFNFSPGIEKFSTNPNDSLRREAKERAFMDITVPVGVLGAINGRDSLDCEALPQNQQADCFKERSKNDRKYEPNHIGTSNASPQVAGIIGLMTSVDRYLGVDLDTNDDGKIDNGPALQRRALNILTFTADKVNDFDNIPTKVWMTEYWWRRENGLWTHESVPTTFSRTFPDSTPYQFQYVKQTNDPLKRSWAQRIGFGRANVYRAVAHAIPRKADYLYATSDTLSIDDTTSMNENRMRLILFGGRRDSGVAVLDSGGVAMPGGDPTHLNQGVTKINGTGTVLVVPDSLIAAIDGIVTTDAPLGNNTIKALGNGKILINGYLNDVEVVGNVRVGNLTINGSDPQSTGCVAVAGNWLTAELFGHVRLTNYGILNLNRGTAVMYPGSVVEMAGNRDVSVVDGGTLRMKFGSMVRSSNGKRLVVDSASTLIVEKDARVEIDCEVVVKNGGTFLVDSGAMLRLKRFTVEKGGVAAFQPGSLVSLTEPGANLCEGTFFLNGTAGRRVRLIGEAAPCCKPVCDSVTQRSAVLIRGDVGDTTVPLALGSVEFADVSNVGIKVVNAVLSPVRESNFSAHRDLFGDRVLIEKLYLPPSASSGISFFTWLNRTLAINASVIEKCAFFDEGGKIEKALDENPYSVAGTRFKGVGVWIQFDSCSFNKLTSAIVTEQSGVVKVTNSTFDSCDIGILNTGAAPFLCNNTFREVSVGTSETGGKQGWAFDNRYDSVLQAWRAWSGAPQRLRGNRFQRFDRGVKVTNNWVYMNTEPTPGGGFYELSGRNTFFLPWSGTSGADIHLGVGDARAMIVCGYNDLAQKSLYHLYSEIPRVVDVSFNKFRDPGAGHLVRTFNVTPMGGPINTADTIPPECDTVLSHDSCSTTGTTCTVDEWWNDAHWISYPREDPKLDTLYWKAREDMNDTNLAWECRAVRAHDAVQAATLGKIELVEERFGELADDCDEIAISSAPDGLKTRALMVQGEIYERWGKPSSAVGSYTTIVSGYPASADSIPAAWRIHAIDAGEADPTTFGFSHDSAMAAWGDRVFDDLTRTAGSPKPVPGIEAGAVADNGVLLKEGILLEENVPNPFNETTTIGFRLPGEAKIRLSVSDERGRLIGVIAEGATGAGRHEVTFRVADLPSGQYFYSLEVEGRVLTRKMTIQR